jgi:hypothetical protein
MDNGKGTYTLKGILKRVPAYHSTSVFVITEAYSTFY